MLKRWRSNFIASESCSELRFKFSGFGERWNEDLMNRWRCLFSVCFFVILSAALKRLLLLFDCILIISMYLLLVFTVVYVYSFLFLSSIYRVIYSVSLTKNWVSNDSFSFDFNVPEPRRTTPKKRIKFSLVIDFDSVIFSSFVFSIRHFVYKTGKVHWQWNLKTENEMFSWNNLFIFGYLEDWPLAFI